MSGETLDPILAARLEELERNLERTIRVCAAKTRDLVLTEYDVDESAWNAAFMKVRSGANDTVARVEDLKANIAEAAEDPEGAWRRYEKLIGETRDVARSCMDLMGAFALRDHMPKDPGSFLDQKLCRFTERLAERCRELTPDQRPPLLAVPASGALGETMVRIIRLQFPDWTIWTLPLVAHEYARVVVPDVHELKPTIRDEVDGRMTSEDGSDREPAEHAVRTLMADVFGVYVMGPAYVCATVLLRLEPLASHSGITDLERAEVIFAAAQRSYRDGNVLEAPAQFVEDFVRGPWSDACGRVVANADLENLSVEADNFAGRALRKIGQATYPEAKFAVNIDEGEDWADAERLSQTWISRAGNPEKASGSNTVYGLREVLNAAWHARLTKEESTPDFARWARAECERATGGGAGGTAEIAHPKGPAR